MKSVLAVHFKRSYDMERRNGGRALGKMRVPVQVDVRWQRARGQSLMRTVSYQPQFPHGLTLEITFILQTSLGSLKNKKS